MPKPESSNNGITPEQRGVLDNVAEIRAELEKEYPSYTSGGSEMRKLYVTTRPNSVTVCLAGTPYTKNEIIKWMTENTVLKQYTSLSEDEVNFFPEK